MRRVAAAGIVAGLAMAAAGAVAAAPEDDLAVVKRAVARNEARQEVRPAPPAEAPAARERDAEADRDRPEARRPRRTGAEPQWLKVRVTEKGSKRARVTINLPLALVRAVGDDFPLDFGDRRWPMRDRERVVRLGEVLAMLDAGQPLVEIDDDEAFVKVWVE